MLSCHTWASSIAISLIILVSQFYSIFHIHLFSCASEFIMEAVWRPGVLTDLLWAAQYIPIPPCRLPNISSWHPVDCPIYLLTTKKIAQYINIPPMDCQIYPQTILCIAQYISIPPFGLSNISPSTM